MLRAFSPVLAATLFAMGVFALSAAPDRAEAQSAMAPSTTIYGGGEVGGDKSAYLGVVAPLPGATQTQGWAVRGVVSGGRYDYETQGVEIEGEYVQGDVFLVRQNAGAWGYVNFGVGARYTDTDLSPNDPGNDRNGSKADAVLTADGVRRFGAWETGAYAEYGVRMQAYFLRADVTRAVGGAGLRLGVEGAIEGDENYDKQRVGAVAVLQRSDALSFRVSAGVKTSDNGDDGYVGLGFVRSF